MRQLTSIPVLAAVAVCWLPGYGQKVTMRPEAARLAAAPDTGAVRSYSLSTRRYSPSDFEAKADYLSSRGFRHAQRVENAQWVSYKGGDERTFFSYDKAKSSYEYSSSEVETIDRAEATDGFMTIASRLMSDLAGAEFGDFKFVNREYELTATSMTPNVFDTAYITFRFVKVLDGRPVLGTSCHARITLGKGGRLSQFEINVPEVAPRARCRAVMRHAASPKYLTADLLKEARRYADHTSIPVSSIEVQKSTEAYFAVGSGGNRTLVPHYCFYAQFTDSLGGTRQGESFVSQDPGLVNVQDSRDIIERE